MGRPPLPIGTFGRINCQATSAGMWRARARYRGDDGRVRFLVAHGTSRSGAESNLKEAIARRQPAAEGAEVTATTRVEAWARRWLAGVQEDDARKQGTRDRYAWIVERVVVPGIGGLTIGECTPGRIDVFLHAVTDGRGASTARTTRAVLSLLLGAAVLQGALKANPVREASRITSPRQPTRALTVAEEHALLRKLDKDDLARAHDLPDLVRFLLGSGCRIGEAIALRESDVDLEQGRVTICATVTDRGRQEATKSAAGHRVIAVPAHVVSMLRRRLDDPMIRTDVAVFPSPLGHLRDTSNTAAHLRRAFDRAGFTWASAHTCRRTVATRLDAAGLSAREVADHLGHAQVSMTQNSYFGRKVASVRAAEALASYN